MGKTGADKGVGCSVNAYIVERSKARDSLECDRINRIYNRSPIQTEKSQPEGKCIMPETRFTEFPALSVDQRVGVSRFASETDY